MALEHRVQIQIDDECHRRISAIARERGVSLATVVLDAIDRALPNPNSQRRAAGQRLLDAPDMPVRDPQELRAELDALRGQHG